MPFEGTFGTEDIVEILDRMRLNCPCPSSNSRRLWKHRRAKKAASHNRSKETLLKRAVATAASISFTGAPQSQGCRWWN